MASLYLLATPIGNLDDLSGRAKRLLASDVVLACEDTRVSRRILNALQIQARLISCRGANGARCIPRLIDQLAAGRDVVYLSDAGTPAVSDPGAALVRSARAAGHRVVPIPGPSAVTALISVSGIAGRGWYFEGFLPPRGAKRRKRLQELVARTEPFVLFEAPHRIERLAQDLQVTAAQWSVVVGREMTKVYEQIVAASVTEFACMVSAGTLTIKGEFSVLVWPGKRNG